jgi:hypothetical protein
MKSTAIPLTCSMALIAMLAAGLSQWWSVNQLVAAVSGTHPKQIQVNVPAMPSMARAAETNPVAAPETVAQGSPKLGTASEKFFEAMLAEMKSLKQQNQDLKDQVAETNRDMMEVQFRLDSYSESFRPLKIAPEPDTTHDDGPGVLPPRAIPAEEELFNQ